VEYPSHSPYFGILLRALYESDTLTEEKLVEWRSLSTARGEGAKDEMETKAWLEIYGRGKVYVDVLEEMESEDEGEEGEDEEDEEED
jgi:translation initiation factor eIF-2B subunit epsilon